MKRQTKRKGKKCPPITREEIEQKTREFLDSGGQITRLPPMDRDIHYQLTGAFTHKPKL